MPAWPKSSICSARMPLAEIYRRTEFICSPSTRSTSWPRPRPASQIPAGACPQAAVSPTIFTTGSCKVAANEYTEVTTTQLWRSTSTVRTISSWPWRGFRRALPPDHRAGHQARCGGAALAGTTAYVAATHDTASSAAAVPPTARDTAYISSGTWSLMGIESWAPLAGESALCVQLHQRRGLRAKVPGS